MKKKVKKIKKLKWPRHPETVIMGLDLSLNGSAGSFKAFREEETFHFLSAVEKKELDFFNRRKDVMWTHWWGKPKGSKMDEFQQADRLHSVLDFIFNMISMMRPVCVAIEDYAYGAKGQVFSLGELGGNVKQYLYSLGIPYRLYDITSIKLFSTGKGTADKSEVMFGCMKRLGKNFFEFGKPKDNVADSFVIVKLLELELKIRRGELELKDLTSIERRIFQRTTKTHPENLLVRPFIQNGESDEWLEWK